MAKSKANNVRELVPFFIEQVIYHEHLHDHYSE
jgi:hypothetical protein